MAIEQWEFFNVSHLLRQGPTVYNDHPRGLLPGFGSGAVTICIYDLGLSRPEIEPRSPACETNALANAAVTLIEENEECFVF